MEVNLFIRMIFCFMFVCLYYIYYMLFDVIYCFVFVLEFFIFYLLKVSKFVLVILGLEFVLDNFFVSVIFVS